uniref:Phospholipid transfer protein n=1 Tax=Salarias fasciatus TaxID=181472 RepID=A0A672FD73_SALFA
MFDIFPFPVKTETEKFVEEELSNISMPEMKGKDGRFQYTITDVKITELNLTHAELKFIPNVGLLFDVQNSSISLTFNRRILYWFLRVYDFLARVLTTGMRFVLNQQICPALNHAALVDVNSMLDTIPVRTEVDEFIGIDYALIDDPVVTSQSLDMHFRGMFFDLAHQNITQVNSAVDPVIREYDRMVYLALSEFFFDSGMFSYYTAGIFQTEIVNEKVQRHLSTLHSLLSLPLSLSLSLSNPALVDSPLSLQLAVNSPPKTTIKTSGATVVMTAIVKVMVLPPGQDPVQLSSMTMEAKFNAKVSMRGKRLSVHADLRRFKIFSNQSALESLALIPLQAPLKTMLQMSVVPLINNWTKRGVRIPLADGMDFIEEVVEYHNGFIVIGANLHFSKGLRDMVAGSMETAAQNNTL